MRVLFHQNRTQRVALQGASGLAHARRPCMTLTPTLATVCAALPPKGALAPRGGPSALIVVLFHQNRTQRVALQGAPAAWLMHGGRV